MTEPFILRAEDVARVLGVSRMTLYRWCRAGDFPPAIRLGGSTTRAVGWRRDEVENWIESRPRTKAETE